MREVHFGDTVRGIRLITYSYYQVANLYANKIGAACLLSTQSPDDQAVRVFICRKMPTFPVCSVCARVCVNVCVHVCRYIGTRMYAHV